MAGTHTDAILKQVRRMSVAPTDAALLTRFVVGCDEDAFAELLRRHGPMVYGTAF